VFYSVISPEYILPVAKMVQIGAQVGTLNKQIFTPHQGMILSDNTNQDIPRLEVSDDKALLVLRGEDWRMDDVNRSGWHIVQWQGMDLAWVKMVKGRVSNHYPKEWRIRYL
jgi:NOL1/NOP2/fmu family ribosome biogenesis protein